MSSDKVHFLLQSLNFDPKLDAVKKTFESNDPEGKVYLDVKMIDLNRHTLALYKRLDDKNRSVLEDV